MQAVPKYFLGFLVLLTVLVWLSVLSIQSSDNLQIITCDVGQGDATLIYQKDLQILIDGGPDMKVLNCLEEHIPFWDRTIELVVISHPQKDHFGGLIEVFRNYKVDTLLSNQVQSGSHDYEVLKNTVGGGSVDVIFPTESSSMRLGMIYLDIVWPTESFIASNTQLSQLQVNDGVLGAKTTFRDPNDFSIVAIIRYKDFDALFTGDIGTDLIGEILNNNLIDDVEYIKIPHHGSRNSLSEELLDVAEPEIAVISSGEGNSYGHPHTQVIQELEERGIEILRTDEMGEIEVSTDGEKVWFED